MDIISKIYENVNIEEGKKLIEKFFVELYFEDRMSSKELAQRLLIPIPLITAIKKESLKEGMLKQENGIMLSDNGIAFVENDLGYKGISKNSYKELMRSGLESDIIKKARADVELIFNNRPSVDVTVDQSKCTVNTAIKRALLALENNSIIGKKIACIGDDDLISVTISLILKKLFNNNPKNTSIYVIEKDTRIIEYINNVSKEYKLTAITCKDIDLKNKMNEELINCFDTVFTDPPYTLNGMELFVKRGIEVLKQEVGLSIFLSYAHKSQDAMLKLEKKILDLGLCICQIIPSFNEYEGAEILGNKGQMIILKTTSSNSINKTKTEEYNELFYTGEIKRTRRKYKCKNCGKEYWVGIEDPITTIEQLKELGCKNCKGNIFELIEKIRKE